MCAQDDANKNSTESFDQRRLYIQDIFVHGILPRFPYKLGTPVSSQWGFNGSYMCRRVYIATGMLQRGDRKLQGAV